jgi:hypothetical protein
MSIVQLPADEVPEQRFLVRGIDKEFFCIHNTSYHDINDGSAKYGEKIQSGVGALGLMSSLLIFFGGVV